MPSKYSLAINVFFASIFLLVLSACSPKHSEENWNKTVQKVSSGVVSIQTDVPVSFDGNWNSSSYATGFIVDAKQGIILTNRHVISPGPITAKAILVNNEEIDLTPLYFDPVHDFGFFRYDPTQIKHITPHEFSLSDRLPDVGEAIRIIGNDAGQKISILDGTISRLDRDAPLYGKGRYNDFNIFYIQAATSSSGGSSGSPVINIKGEAVALNAGSQTKSANAFYLPLDKIKAALKQLQNKQLISRGTLKATFNYTPYEELKRLGLSDELETKYRKRFPQQKGLLVARQLLPDSTAFGALEVGDVLLAINEKDVVNFSQLESAFDSNVDKEISLQLVRNGEVLTTTALVDDLHKLSPASLVKFDGSTFHALSYQQARHFNKPISGVYVASSGGSFSNAGVPSKSVITEFNGVNIESVEDLNEQLKVVENQAKINLRYFDFSTPNTTNYRLVEINRQWFEHSYCQKDPSLSYWPCAEVTYAERDNKDQADTLIPSTNVDGSTLVDSKTVVDSNNLEDALVTVTFTSPYSIQGRSGNKSHYGTGVIVDIEKGWVVVAQSIVFSKLGDVKMIFNNRYEINANVEYIHPLHNLALISYDPTELKNATVSQVTFSDKAMQKGETIVQMGLNYDGNVEYRQTIVDTTEELWLRQFNVPQYIDKNIEATHFVNPNTAIDGIIVNQASEVTGLWITFDASDENGKEKSSTLAGFSAAYVKDLINTVESNSPVYSLDIDMTMLAPVNAIQMGLDETWLDKLQANNSSANKVLAVYNISTSSNSAEFLKRGDLILAIDDKPVSSFRQVEEATQKPNVNVTYFSEGSMKTAQINTRALHGVDIDRVVYWSGLYLHAPHRAAQLQGNVDASGVYVASYRYGSPATRYGVYAMQRIVEIDGVDINTIEDFIKAVKGKEHQASTLIKTLDFNNVPNVITLKVNNHYWPFYELKYANGQWRKIDHSSDM